MPAEMGHVSLVSHEAFTAVVTSEGKISGVTTLVSDQLVAITELLLTVVTSIPAGEGEHDNQSPENKSVVSLPFSVFMNSGVFS